MIQVGFKSDKGLRRGNNEDACFIMPKEKVFVIADGVGGGAAGEIASRTAVSMVAEYVKNSPPETVADVNDLRAYFLPCFEEVNAKLFELTEKYIENAGMATTAVVCYIGGKQAYFVNIGDSRAYICRHGMLQQITEDHSYVNDLVKTGIITEKDAATHAKKNMITRALGADIICEPDFFQVDIEVGDVVLLCTDGLYGEVDEAAIAEIISRGRTMTETCANLVYKANQHGGRDNITVICVKI